uniref:Uncharacterized protein n=1 Tax=Tetradesmus obliquus TaxID=3088 RepID=A0A383WNG3_TETOB|eukprot:jgi/Sobl393_1/13868/SZX78987.1
MACQILLPALLLQLGPAVLQEAAAAAAADASSSSSSSSSANHTTAVNALSRLVSYLLLEEAAAFHAIRAAVRQQPRTVCSTLEACIRGAAAQRQREVLQNVSFLAAAALIDLGSEQQLSAADTAADTAALFSGCQRELVGLLVSVHKAVAAASSEQSSAAAAAAAAAAKAAATPAVHLMEAAATILPFSMQLDALQEQQQLLLQARSLALLGRQVQQLHGVLEQQQQQQQQQPVSHAEAVQWPANNYAARRRRLARAAESCVLLLDSLGPRVAQLPLPGEPASAAAAAAAAPAAVQQLQQQVEQLQQLLAPPLSQLASQQRQQEEQELAEHGPAGVQHLQRAADEAGLLYHRFLQAFSS